MKNTIICCIFCLLLSSCSKTLFTESTQNPLSLYDEFWTHVNDNYIFFQEKEVDWEDVYQKYSKNLSEHSSEEELLQAMENSLLELKDAHNVIRTPFRASKKYNYTEGYAVHFSPELVEEKYIKGNFAEERSFRYGAIDEESIYIYVPKMESIHQLRNLIRNLVVEQSKNLIIDVRNNGGGNSNPVPELLGDFVDKETLLGSYIEKSGPKREDETVPLPVYAFPSPDYHFDIKVALLINRAGYSATSYLAGMCKGLDNFTLFGQVTGGGAGGNAGYELSNGWELAISVSDFIDKQGNTIELGVQPDIEVINQESDISNGVDVMLEAAIDHLRSGG